MVRADDLPEQLKMVDGCVEGSEIEMGDPLLSIAICSSYRSLIANEASLPTVEEKYLVGRATIQNITEYVGIVEWLAGVPGTRSGNIGQRLVNQEIVEMQETNGSMKAAGSGNGDPKGRARGVRIAAYAVTEPREVVGCGVGIGSQ
jgi:hypothetical protein